MTSGLRRPIAGLLGILLVLPQSLALAQTAAPAPKNEAPPTPPPAPPAPVASDAAAPKAAEPAAAPKPAAPSARSASAPAPSAPPAKPAEPAKPPEAKKVDDAARAEAAHRFDRGLQLFDSGDNAGALAEFKRTYEILPNPVVLYNIGLVYAAMARPVEATDALETAVGSGGLSPKQLERGKQTLAEQKARVGRLNVTTTPDGARIEVDNVEVARTPLSAPIRISEGSHIIGAVAEGFAPGRKEVVVAGNSDAMLHLDLVPTQGKRLANLTVRTSTAGADVRVDGQVVGHTPLATSVTLVAGHHAVELRRPGYTPVTREVDVGEGATGDLAFELVVDPASLSTDGATLVLDPSESPVELSVDGERKGIYAGPLRLPRGPHHISVAAAGFIPLERDVNLDGVQTNLVRLVLEPTPDKRASYRSNAYFHRTWGWVGVISGAVIAGGSAAFAVVASGQKSDAQKDLDAINLKYDKNQPPCDASNGFLAEPIGQMTPYLCNKAISDAKNKVNAAKTRQTIGFIGVGVGGAVIVTGLVLLLTGDDPDKYEHPGSGVLGKAPAPRLALVPGPGDIGYGLRLTF